MTDTLGTTLSAEAKTFYDRNLLERALPILGMAKGGQQRQLKKNQGNSVEYRRFNTLTTATTALNEGITPVAANLSVSTVTGTVAQYGNYVQISDAVDLLAIDQVITESTDLLGENGGQSVEEIIRAELVTGTSVSYGTGSTRGAQSSANPITHAMVRKAVRTLAANDALPFYSTRSEESGLGGMFLGFIHPNQYYDLVGDSAVQNTMTYSDPDKFYTQQLPVIAQVMWVVTTKAPKFAGAGSGGADVYGAIITGKNAYGVVNVAGTGKFSTIVKPVGSAGASDPLDQRGTVGWKAWQLPKILNNAFMTRIETGVSA